MTSLQQLIESSPSLFADSVRESESTLLELEAALNVSLPSDLRWFWQFCGSGNTDVAPNARRCIGDTIRFRSTVSLPPNYLVLDDRNDGGTVFLDTDSSAGAVIWVDYHAVEKIGLGDLLPAEHDLFPAFTDWVSFCIEQASDAA